MSRTMTPQDALRSLQDYSGGKSQVFKDLGDQEACDLLHLAFEGNATAAAEFLGFKHHDSVVDRWVRYGLIPLGRDSSRRGYSKQSAPDDGSGPFSNYSLDEWEKHYLCMTQAEEHAVETVLHVPKGVEYIRVHYVGDLHFGNRNQDTKLLLEFIEWLQEPEQEHDRWFGLGDFFEQRSRSAKGAPAVIPEEVSVELATKWLSPIMPKCLGLLTGNHDDRVLRETDMPYCPVRDIGRRFGVPVRGRDAFHRITLKQAATKLQQIYLGYYHHGYGGARTRGARETQIERQLLYTNADFCAMAHLHDRSGGSVGMFGVDDDGMVEQWHKTVVRTGSWLKHQSGSYSRDAGMPPGVRGAATVHLYVTQHSVHQRT